MFVPRLTPYAHQSEAVRVLSEHDAFALFLDMGTGKTKIVLDEYSEECSRGNGLTDLLIVAPAGSYSNWLNELDTHLDPRLREQLAVAKWKSGNKASAKAVARLLATDETETPRVLIVNVEALSTVFEAKEACLKFLQKRRATLVVDESTAIKSPRASRSMFLVNLAAPLAVRRRILSGLPSPNSPMDLYTQFKFLDWRILGFPTFRAFRARYAILKSVLFPGARMPTEIIVNYRDVDKLHDQIKPFSYRKTKEECLDLPPKVYMPPREVTMTNEQRKIYHDLKEKATSEIEKDVHVSASLVITKMLRLHQVLCGHVVDEDGVQREVPTNRIKALLEVLDQHSGKAIIWANYNHSIAAIAEAIAAEKDEDGKLRYGEEGVAVFYGGNASSRLDDERRWKTDPRCRFLVASQGAGSLGNTWVEADLVVYYSNDFNLEHRLQSEDRAHRAGQTKSVTYVDLVVPGTVDEKIITALRKKIDMSATITGDNYREWLV